jgi:predicted DsbA family dithiol-disulfide isomerase
VDSSKYAAKVRASVAEGKSAGVRGTPGFFLGLTDPNEPTLQAVTYIEGAQRYADFKKVIDRLLSLPKE